MIIWLTGNTGAGKTTLAKRLSNGQSNTVVLDGDMLREVWPGLSLSSEDREEHCLRTARLAKLLEDQGLCVIVAVIAPYKDLRHMIKTVCGCVFVYLPDGLPDSLETPYEPPTNPAAIVRKQ